MDGGVFRRQFIQAFHHCLRGGHLVGAGLLGDLEQHAAGGVHIRDGVGVRGLQCHVCHLAQADRTAGGQRDQHIGHVLHRLELSVGTDRQLLGAAFQIAAGIEQVLRRQDLRDIAVGKAQLRGPGGIQLYGDLLVYAAVNIHGGHAVDPLQRRHHHVVRHRLQIRQVLAHQSDHGGRHHVADVDVDNNGVHGAVRQGEHVELLPQLGGGDVHVRAVHIGDLHLADAVG